MILISLPLTNSKTIPILEKYWHVELQRIMFFEKSNWTESNDDLFDPNCTEFGSLVTELGNYGLGMSNAI